MVSISRNFSSVENNYIEDLKGQSQAKIIKKIGDIILAS